MELYWPEEGFPNHSGNFPLQPPHALSHTSAGSARGSLDSAENLLPLASCLIKKLAGDQKKKTKKKHGPCSHTRPRPLISTAQHPARAHQDLKLLLLPLSSYPAQPSVLKFGVALNVPNCISWSGGRSKTQISFFFPPFS